MPKKVDLKSFLVLYKKYRYENFPQGEKNETLETIGM